jgi:predicted ATP-binding protein involved in virulence
MKLSKIEITNFRCFESLSLSLQSDVNVLVGANGAGKSTILDAIAIALYPVILANGGGGAKQERKRQGVTLKPTDILVEPRSREATTGRRDFVQFRASATDYYPLPGFPATTPTGESRFLEWSDFIQYVPPAGFHYETTSSQGLSEVNRYFNALWQEIRGSNAMALIPLPVAAYYRANRRIVEMPSLGDVFAVSFSRDKAFANALDAGASFRSMCQWFYLRENEELRAQATVSQPPTGFSDLVAVRKVLSHAIEHLERVFFDGSPPRLKARLRDSDGVDRDLELVQLSDGYRNLLALFFDFARRLAQAHPDWANPLEAPGILLIDEVELHLHPRWQQTVITSLRAAFPNTQLIVSTHSPAVLQTVRREQIRLFGIDHSLASLPSDFGTYGSETPRILAEVFGADVRPPAIESVPLLIEYMELVESRQHDSQRAKEIRSQLDRELGSSDPDLRVADARIALLSRGQKQ